jgi:hypothetical protein
MLISFFAAQKTFYAALRHVTCGEIQQLALFAK